ncbi:hypothetical protein MAM1_0020c01731 [Mucor ambiguus]|uniref:Homeobox domain-containing protein n=1 Tax=Mucor ambiguus TaxID=91626 RepID=A0A0C9MKE5_9FUNG|nr:hypothetical protein MAM1_0020c01731 [Mucor ambiguus]
MTKFKRKVTSSKVPQKVALPAYRYSPSKSKSPDEVSQSSGSADIDRGLPTPPGFPDQDGDAHESGTDQSHTTSSSGDFPRIPVRPRQRFTTDETAGLEQVYRRNKRPSNEIKQRLARRFSTSVSRIQIWFQNRRAKEKKANNNTSDQRASTAAASGQAGGGDSDATPSDNPEQSESSKSTATWSSGSRRKKALRKPSVSPVVAESSSSVARKRKKQIVPVAPATIPENHSFPPSGSYTFTYPGFAASPTQPMNSANVPNTPMSNESFLYQGQPPSHPSHTRGGFLVPKFDWHHPHIVHPSFAPAFQGSHPIEKPLKYVDPKKVVKPESSQPMVDQMNGQGTTSSSSIRSLSRKGKQKQNAIEMVDSDSEQSSSEEQVEGDS